MYIIYMFHYLHIVQSIFSLSIYIHYLSFTYISLFIILLIHPISYMKFLNIYVHCICLIIYHFLFTCLILLNHFMPHPIFLCICFIQLIIYWTYVKLAP